MRRDDIPTAVDNLRTNVVVLACAVSAGIHGALTPDHFRENTGAGAGFLVATLLLAALAVTLTRRPTEAAFGATAVVLVGLLASYVLAVTTGLPLLHPEREQVEGLALFTKAVEAAGLTLSAGGLHRLLDLRLPDTKGSTA